MTAVYGYHVQDPQPEWDDGVARQPIGALNKSVDNVHTLQTAKSRNQNTLTKFRKWYDPWQIFGGDWEANKEKARVFFDTFVDDTFRELAAAGNIDFIGGWNEYVAPNQPDLAEKILWVQASQHVWATEYRTQSELENIRLASVAAAVGNDIHIDMARAVYDNGGALDYHAYTAVHRGSHTQLRSPNLAMVATHPPRAKFTGTKEPYFVLPPPGWHDLKGVINPGDWQWYSGRWVMMDDQFKSQGIYCDWLFGEAGCVRQYDHGGLDPLGGWMHPDTYNGNIDDYLEMMKYWLDKTAEWNHYNNGRALGAVLFTTGGPGSTWDSFEVLQPHINTIADYMSAYQPPEFPPIEEPPMITQKVTTSIEQIQTHGANEIRINVLNRDGERIQQAVLPITDDARRLYVKLVHNSDPEQDEYRPIGCDVSHWQGAINFQTMYNAGARWVYIKATESGNHVDVRLDENWNGAGAAGLKRTCYHFWRASVGGVFQANHFVDWVNSLHGIPDWPLVLDVEDTNVIINAPSFARWSAQNRISQKEIDKGIEKETFIRYAKEYPDEVRATDEEAQNVRDCLAHIEERTAVRPIVYTGSWYWNPRFGHLDFSEYRHIEAEYTHDPDIAPSPSNGLGALYAHQYTSSGDGPTYGASSANIDLNVFYGWLSEM